MPEPTAGLLEKEKSGMAGSASDFLSPRQGGAVSQAAPSSMEIERPAVVGMRPVMRPYTPIGAKLGGCVAVGAEGSSVIAKARSWPAPAPAQPGPNVPPKAKSVHFASAVSPSGDFLVAAVDQPQQQASDSIRSTKSLLSTKSNEAFPDHLPKNEDVLEVPRDSILSTKSLLSTKSKEDSGEEEFNVWEMGRNLSAPTIVAFAREEEIVAEASSREGRGVADLEGLRKWVHDLVEGEVAKCQKEQRAAIEEETQQRTSSYQALGEKVAAVQEWAVAIPALGEKLAAVEECALALQASQGEEAERAAKVAAPEVTLDGDDGDKLQRDVLKVQEDLTCMQSKFDASASKLDSGVAEVARQSQELWALGAASQQTVEKLHGTFLSSFDALLEKMDELNSTQNELSMEMVVVQQFQTELGQTQETHHSMLESLRGLSQTRASSLAVLESLVKRESTSQSPQSRQRATAPVCEIPLDDDDDDQ